MMRGYRGGTPTLNMSNSSAEFCFDQKGEEVVVGKTSPVRVVTFRNEHGMTIMI